MKKRRRRRSIWRRVTKGQKLGLIIAAIAIVVGIALILFSPRPEISTDTDYQVSEGYEGLRVKRVMEALDLGATTGMGGAYFQSWMSKSVSDFQTENGLKATGVVDINTWKALGYTEEEWKNCGSYQSPCQLSEGASREEKIEAMIERAYEYLGDPYVIGASGPPGEEYGLDCSGLAMQALYAAGVSMEDITPATHAHPGHEYESRNIWNSDHFTLVDYEDRERGDLIFYENGSGLVIHIAIYLGDDEVIESWPNEVQVSPVIDSRHPYIKGVKRVFE